MGHNFISASLAILICLAWIFPGPVAAVNLDVIYEGESTVDLEINNDIIQEYKRFILKRNTVQINAWNSLTGDDDLYFSDTVPAFSAHTYTLDSYWGTNGVHWIHLGTDTETADTSVMRGTLHNSLEWQLKLGRGSVSWTNLTAGYTVSSVSVVDGDLGIYNTTVRLNDSAHFLQATGPGAIYAAGTTFTSSTTAGGEVWFANQSDLVVELVNNCSFENVNLRLTGCNSVEIKNTGFDGGELITDINSSGLLLSGLSGSYDLDVSGVGQTVQNCSGIGTISVSGSDHVIRNNGVREIVAGGETCTIEGNTFDSGAFNWIRFDISGNGHQILENTLEHREADSGYPMIRITGDNNNVQGNTVTEYVGGAGAWGNGINIQNGTGNTVQLNHVIGYISGYSTNNHGIVVDGGSGNLVKKNTIRNCQNGIWLGYPNPTTGNNIENNAISSTIRAAIDVNDGSGDNVFAFNHIWDGSTGMYISGAANGVHENIVSGCSYLGIELLAGASNCWVYNNVFRDNNRQAEDNGTGNHWNKPKTAVAANIVGGPYLGGNYWDNYTGSDTDGDKLGDTPFPISGTAGSSDNLPLIYVSMPSPTPAPTPETMVIDSGDYNGDGTSNIAIFRGGTGLWAIRGLTRVYFGSASDLPVSGDYAGNGTAGIAIFRGSSGLWAVRGLTRTYFGSSSDYPVPADYNGDGTCDAGVFRPATGLWAVRSVTRAYFGSSSDIPAPGDYSGGPAGEIAVFRPATGLWAVRGATRLYFGGASDIPAPGDYDANGSREAGIFRPSTGLWAIRSVTRLYFGGAADRPVPADYRGAGIDEVGIFRSGSGLWAVRGVTRAYFGGTGDIPVTR